MGDLSSALGRPSGGVHPSEKEADVSSLPSTVGLVVVCSSQLASAIAAQRGTGRAVVAQRTPWVCADHRVALVALVVAGCGSKLAGAVQSAGVARWLLAVVARTSHADRGLSVSDTAPGQACVRLGIGR